MTQSTHEIATTGSENIRDGAAPSTKTDVKAGTKSRGRRIFGRILIALLVFVVLITSVGAWYVRRPWPQLNGTVQIDGLSAPVEVIRDEWGVPHIYAESDIDLFMAQGFITAQDRLWQMEFYRRQASGRAAEVLGPSGLFYDTFMRNMRLRSAAETAWEQMEPEYQAYVQAYADGVNAFLAEHEGKLPIEFTVLGYEPEPWSPIDMLAFGNLLSMHLSSNRRIELIRALIVDEVGEDVMNTLLPDADPKSPTVIPEEANFYDGFKNLDISQLDPDGELLGTPASGIGSNAWVVNGDHTDTGLPILANDIHIFPSAPSLWYGIGLHSENFSVTGFALAGTPGIITGNNDDITWAFTNFAPDHQDYYMEKLDDLENPTQYEFEGEWLDLEIIKETVGVKGQADEEITIYMTHHGPIMNPLLEQGEALSLRWALYDGNQLFKAIVDLNQATNFEEYRAALSNWQIPGQNSLYADKLGNIGFQSTGRIPIRQPGHAGTVPVPGWTGEYEWESYIPWDEMPSIYNPPSGILVTANSKIVDDDYPYRLADSYVPGYRSARIREMLDSAETVTVEVMEVIQADTFAPTAEVLIPYLSAVEPTTDLHTEALELVLAWDMFHETDRLGAVVYDAWHIALLDNIISDEMGEDAAYAYSSGHYIRHATQHVPMLFAIMEDENHPWFDDISTDEIETREDIIQRSFEEAVNGLSGQFGTDPSSWVWGEIHYAVFPHYPFFQLGNPFVDMVFNSGKYPARGSNFAIHTNSYSWDDPFATWIASNARHVADTSNWSNSIMMASTGQSGHIFHPHRFDLSEIWAEAGSHPMEIDRTEVEKIEANRLILEP